MTPLLRRATLVLGLFFPGVAGYLLGCGGGRQGAADASVPTGTETPPTRDTMTFAFDHIFLGDALPGLPTSPTAWEKFGHDRDHRWTKAGSTDVCTPWPGAPPDNQVDAENGVDNAFGKLVVPAVQQVLGLTDLSASITDATLALGVFALQLRVTGLSSDSRQLSFGLVADLFTSGEYQQDGSVNPAFDTTTDWPVLPDLLVDPNDLSKGSQDHFGDAYIAGGAFTTSDVVWTNPEPPIAIDLVFSGVPVSLTIHNPLITFDHSSPSTATNGMIAGVFETAQVLSALRAIFGLASPSLCGSTWDQVATQVEQASDMLSDGTNAPGQPCDGISFGIGFTARQIANPTRVAPPHPDAGDPCTWDAGTDGGDAGTGEGGAADAGGD